MCPNSIYAIAVSEDQALKIEDRLTQAGFSNSDISALIPDRDSNAAKATGPHPRCAVTAPIAGTTGGVFGVAVEMFASIGALAIPGIGRLIAVGPLLATLSGVAAGAVVGISGALVGLGLPNAAAVHYESRIAKGDILISVQVESTDDVRKATEVLQESMAEDIAVTAIVDA